ncbi:MAG: peptidase M48 [Ignavibacteria bacterium RIFOXYB2_FULL_35_12]|uniref:M48 family metallopeptidase n=1 Tax=Sulfurimonas sp. RIFOXYB12_FULL_35_9 TaxID=1802256 RepID=UPI0008D4720B|nr:M48 family metallopeptidase [Sulfurimonas sp. RIFOXYB12_FULL_35_9]OGU58239.1 MAG: peptidase M48 [Ignavibacteria bacterium GWF2_35_20]OGU82579.1 MAG: peptidase M48 [Ignavibacteria bacterium RIFOXYA2_FULL_35_9]OGU98224.1 MAG: peptidase M48 [Ignavibacteria bacterium RIFOXYC2_FULL_35_16]OGV04692.1 MAG: peptidase M48 [Ignavibacteria bacterium RIFOXYB2_FULL_35_12]OGV29721.1 MAG: peptidase M48 [Ignavibacteria bacterium RIFOXYD12_FULL_36_8]
MQYLIKIFLPIIIFSIIGISCSTVAITGRKQLNIIPDSEMLSMSFQQYDEFIKTNKLSANVNNTNMVKRAGSNIQNAVQRYFAENNMSDRLNGYNWEFNLVESADVNAWCMPGGKVVVYTGILPLTQDESGLAVVMGHEIAHAIAEHGNERMSQILLTQLGGIALSEALSSQPLQTRDLWLGVYGLGAQVGVLLPYSRTHESEADKLGLIFMSMAGYDPNVAVDFWERMAAQKQGQAPPEFLSTHPSDRTRIEDIKKNLPEAMKYYNK